MIMKNYYLYLIRHGITEGNLDGKYIGQTDLALCPQGEKQIQQLVKASVYPCVEKVYTSPLKRCVETAPVSYTHLDVYKRQMLISPSAYSASEHAPALSQTDFQGCSRVSRTATRCARSRISERSALS